MTASSSSRKSLMKPLYRSLLRATKPFNSSENGPILCSLLHRTGLDDHIDYSKLKPLPSESPPPPKNKSSTINNHKNASNGNDNAAATSIKNIHVPKELARDLSRSYDDLRQAYFQRIKSSRLKHASSSDDDGSYTSFPPIKKDDDDDESGDITSYQEMNLETMFSEAEVSSPRGPPGHLVLYKRLLREILGDGVHMNFPSENIGSEPDETVGARLNLVIRREFRNKIDHDSPDTDDENDQKTILSTQYSDAVRRDVAFLALREINKKLAWGKSLGMEFQENKSQCSTCDQEEYSKKKKRERHIYRRQAAKDVVPLPKIYPKSYLRPGSFLVAHPLLSGYFSKTVICILDHTDLSNERSTKIENDDIDLIKAANSLSDGGSYGLVLNRNAMVSVPGGNVHRKRNRALREVINPNHLPEGMKVAFGNCLVREGGPVNMSIQMLYTNSAEEVERLGIGGSLLPMIMGDDTFCNVDNSDGAESSKILPSAPSGSLKSAALNTDHAVYFGGDVIKAAQAVIDDEMNQDDFSFVVGASCWEAGQLENEVQRGYWLPCQGPPQIALTGRCSHNIEYGEKNVTKSTDSKNIEGLSEWSPKSDLWLSMMCALGDEEARMAHLFLNDEYDENGEACDDF